MLNLSWSTGAPSQRIMRVRLLMWKLRAQVENWADNADDREAEFSPAVVNPVFYGAEW